MDISRTRRSYIGLNLNADAKAAGTGVEKTSKRMSKCKVCGKPIFFRFLELFERQNPNQMLQWRRVFIRSWWAVYDVENPGLIHRHKLGKSEEALAANSRDLESYQLRLEMEDVA